MSVGNRQARVAIVTGAAQGIGKAIAESLLERGWHVALFDRETAVSQAVGHPCAESHRVDVGNEADVSRAIATVADRHGRLDGLINNAGIMIRKPMSQLSLAEWNRVLSVNLTGAFLCTRTAAELLAASGGAVVNIASTRALMSEPDTEAYAASKGGLVALTHAMALSLGPKVRVNCVSPGWIHTHGDAPGPTDHAQHPAGRVGAPGDVAALVCWLLSEEAGFVTGANFVTDGGMTRKMIYED